MAKWETEEEAEESWDAPALPLLTQLPVPCEMGELSPLLALNSHDFTFLPYKLGGVTPISTQLLKDDFVC